MNLSYSSHAQTRMRQRGLSKQDIELIVQCGSLIRRGLRLLRGKDIDHEIKRIKRRVQNLERLRNCAVVIEDDKVITCYHLFGRAGRHATRRTNRRSKRFIGRKRR